MCDLLHKHTQQYSFSLKENLKRKNSHRSTQTYSFLLSLFSLSPPRQLCKVSQVAWFNMHIPPAYLIIGLITCLSFSDQYSPSLPWHSQDVTLNALCKLAHSPADNAAKEEVNFYFLLFSLWRGRLRLLLFFFLFKRQKIKSFKGLW